MADHRMLIDSLSQSLAPIRRTRPPVMRALCWVALALPSGFLATKLIPTFYPDWTAPGMGWAIAQVGLALVLGMAAVMLAFDTSIPGRPLRARSGAVLFVAGQALVWLTVCAGNMLASPQLDFNRLGAGVYCYTFMTLAGAPMIVMVILALRQTRALHPRRTLLVAGVGVAFAAAGLLGFCHPGTLHVADFCMHLAAGATIVGLTTLIGRRFVAA